MMRGRRSPNAVTLCGKEFSPRGRFRALSLLWIVVLSAPGVSYSQSPPNPLAEIEAQTKQLYEEAQISVVGIRIRLPNARLTEVSQEGNRLRISVTGPFGQWDEPGQMALVDIVESGDKSVEPVERRRPAQGPVDRHGTGIAYDTRGHVISTYRLIHDCTAGSQLFVIAPDGTEFPARIVGKDPYTNIAVLRASGLQVHPAAFREEDPDRPQPPPPGSFILCIARPYGLPNSLYTGVVSGVDRTIGQTRYERLIQTTIPLHPGSNGAPILLMDGTVAGMLSCTLKQPGWGEVSFAIPSYMLTEIAGRLVEKGEMVRGYLGVRVANVGELQEDPRFEHTRGLRGVVVIGVLPNTPAVTAGLATGDVIIGINEAQIESRDTLIWKISRIPPGEEVTIQWVRNGETHRRTARIASLPDAFANVSGARP
jgi:S1-C subfamily serine protease